MHFSKLSLTSLAALTPFAHAVGDAIIKNKCDFPVYLWSVNSVIGDMQTVGPHSSFNVGDFTRDPNAGTAIKIRRIPDLNTADPELDFAYTLDPGRLWYDLSSVWGSPFAGYTVKVWSGGECPAICWPDGEKPAGSTTQNCSPDVNEYLVLCGGPC